MVCLASFGAPAAGAPEGEPPRAKCAGKRATAVGTPGNDVIRLGTKRHRGHVVATGSGRDRIVGTKRRDLICSGQGNDVVRAGGGPDRVLAAGGEDRVIGGGGKDALGGRGGRDRIRGGKGDDFVGGGGKTDRLSGGGGADRIIGAGGQDRISGGKGADALTGGANNDKLSGGNRSDFLEGATGDDVLNGGGADDRLIAATGKDVVRGGDGIDVATLGPGRDIAFGGPGPDDIDAGPGLDDVHGEEGDDRLHGEAGPDLIDGGGGDDAVYGELVDDHLLGGPGNDLISGGHGSDDLMGGDGNDVVRGDFGQDFHWGDAGNDTVSYATATPPGPAAGINGVRVNLPAERGAEDPPHPLPDGDDPRELVKGIENVVGSNFDDEFIGGGGGAARGLGGTETCIGFASSDCGLDVPNAQTTVTLDGGLDPGLLVKGPATAQGNEVLIAPTATGLSISGTPMLPGSGCAAAGPTTVTCPSPGRPLGYIVAWTGAGDDAITIAAGFQETVVIQLDGGEGNDTLRGGESSEVLLAGPSGTDALLGSGGDDALISGPGADVLSGSAGNDQMVASTPCDGHRFSGDAGSGDIAGFALSFQHGVDATIGGTAVARGVSPCSPSRIGADNEVLEGTQYADVLRGNRRPNFLILGRHGNDLIFGRGGRDVLRGDEGADSLYGGGGKDVLQARDSRADTILHCGRGGRRAVRDKIRSGAEALREEGQEEEEGKEEEARREEAPLGDARAGGDPRRGRARCSSSATWTAFVAAPLRRLSPTTQRLRQRSCEGSRRMRPTSTSSRPSTAIGRG